MKQFAYRISSFSKPLFFPHERVKTKVQILNILLEASRYILSNPVVEDEDFDGEIRLVIDKMNRLFFYSDKKFYSISFPFKIDIESEKHLLSFNNNMPVDAYLISKAKSVINSSYFNDTCVLSFAESLLDLEGENEEIWGFVKDLLLLEDGYIRYDNDPIGFREANEKGYPDRHPLNHYDLFYSNRATFKVGLKNTNSHNDFIDLVNIKTDCKYINN